MDVEERMHMLGIVLKRKSCKDDVDRNTQANATRVEAVLKKLTLMY